MEATSSKDFTIRLEDFLYPARQTEPEPMETVQPLTPNQCQDSTCSSTTSDFFEPTEVKPRKDFSIAVEDFMGPRRLTQQPIETKVQSALSINCEDSTCSSGFHSLDILDESNSSEPERPPTPSPEEPVNLCIKDGPARFPWNPPGGGLHPLASQLPDPFRQRSTKPTVIFKGGF